MTRLAQSTFHSMLLALATSGCSEPSPQGPPNRPDATSTIVEPTPAAGDDDDADVDGGDVPSAGVLQLQLELGATVVATGAARVVENEVAASGICTDGVELYEATSFGIFPGRPSFVDRTAGSASTMGEEGVRLAWNPSNPSAANIDVTDEWIGTYAISIWSADQIVLELVAGVHCDLPDRSGCVPATGSLTFTGSERPVYELDATYSRYMGYVDDASGDPVCGSTN